MFLLMYKDLHNIFQWNKMKKTKYKVYSLFGYWSTSSQPPYIITGLQKTQPNNLTTINLLNHNTTTSNSPNPYSIFLFPFPLSLGSGILLWTPLDCISLFQSLGVASPRTTLSGPLFLCEDCGSTGTEIFLILAQTLSISLVRNAVTGVKSGRITARGVGVSPASSDEDGYGQNSDGPSPRY